MIQYVLWAVSFVSLWISLVWLNVIVLEPSVKRPTRRQGSLPRVTIALPCYNKQPFLAKTVQSLAALNYPRELLQIIIVDDCSTDKTFTEAKRLQRAYPQLNMSLIRHSCNQGKAGALNTALAHATGALFACLDADTRVHPDALRHHVSNFTDRHLGAVISQVKVDEPRKFYERLQRVEYIFSNFIRRLMSNLGTLALTPGVLSMYRTDVLAKVGRFAEGGLTEDLEIALRLRANGYKVQMEPRALTFTSVPQKWGALWRQRVRWYRGFVINHFRYRHLLFKQEQGLYGMFQMPLNILGIIMLLTTVLLVGYGNLSDLYELLYRSLTIKGYFINHVLDFPSLKELLLGQNVQIMIPLILCLMLGAYLVYLAHKRFQEGLLKHIHHVVLYFVVAPYVTTVHWLAALMHEALGTRRKW